MRHDGHIIIFGLRGNLPFLYWGFLLGDFLPPPSPGNESSGKFQISADRIGTAAATGAEF